jgi:hypothetical protein
VPVIRIARHGPRADDEAFVDGRGDRYLGAEFVTHAGLALGNAIDLG